MDANTKIDHIVIGARSLAAGVEYIREVLNVDIPFGGEHPKMGTHNHVMRLGEGSFLEVIAVCDTIKSPERPRWYGLDDPYIRYCLERQPALLTWVVSTPDIDDLIRRANYALGQSELVTRGDLSWHFALPEDGRLLAGGLLPYAIQWHSERHPSEAMADLGCRIRAVDIFHPYPAWLKHSLDSIGASSLVRMNALEANETPNFSVEIDTPSGTVYLRQVGYSRFSTSA